MSCLWFWCCRGQQSDSDTENKVNDELKNGGKIKKKKKWRTKKRKEQQKKEKTKEVQRAEESQASPQPAEGEKESEAPHVPAGLVSGSLDNISAVILEKTGTPLHEDFLTSEDIPEASSHPRENSLVQIEAEAEAEDITPLVCTDQEEQEADNNQVLENEKLKKTTAEAEAEAIQELMNIYLDETEETKEKDLENVELKMMTAETEAEAIEQLMNIYLDETEDSMEQHLGDEMFEATLTEDEVEAVKQLMLLFVDQIEAELLGGEVMNVTDTEPEAPTFNMQSYLDEADTPNDHPLGDEMFEATLTEAEVEAVKQLMLLFVDKIEAESLGCEEMNVADTEAEASTHSIQTNLDETDTLNDHPLDVEKTFDTETDWNTIKCLMVDLLSDVEGTVDHSLGNEMHKVTDVEAEADDLNNMMDIHLDETETTVKQALGKEVMTDPEPIKSWAYFIDETEGTVDQSTEIKPLKKDFPGNEAKTNQQKKKTRRGTRGKGRKINYKKGPRREE